MVVCSICLSDIPKEKITNHANGKKYLNIVIAEKQTVDQYGNTHSVAINQTKEQREAKEPKVYIGSGKSYEFVQRAEVVQEVKQELPMDDGLGLPF